MIMKTLICCYSTNHCWYPAWSDQTGLNGGQPPNVQLKDSRVNTAGRNTSIKKEAANQALLAGVRSPPAPPAQEYVNPELNLTVIRGHASLSRDFLPTDLWTMKNLPSPSLQIKKVTMTETKMNHLTNYSITLEGVCSYTTIGRMISKSPFWDRDITKLTVSIKHVQIPFVGKWLT